MPTYAGADEFVTITDCEVDETTGDDTTQGEPPGTSTSTGTDGTGSTTSSSSSDTGGTAGSSTGDATDTSSSSGTGGGTND